MADLWKPTYELKYVMENNVVTIEREKSIIDDRIKVLKQKWVEVITGKEEWREIITEE